MQEAIPNVVVSRCIEFDHCRFNGLIISSEFVKKLSEHVNFIPICPEVEIGLGIPRPPVRLVDVEGDTRMIQPETGADVTESMIEFSYSFLKGLKDIDGFVLKGRSPSCGVKETKLYSSIEGGHVVSKGQGLFASKVYELFPLVPIEDELRTRNHNVREHFLTQLFTLSRFRDCKRSGNMGDLVAFHSSNKYLFMSYNQSLLKEMGRLVANEPGKDRKSIFTEYGGIMRKLINSPPRYTSHINVIMHLLGYFKKDLSHTEKSFLLDLLTQYRRGVVPLSALQAVIGSWALRFDEKYLLGQTYLNPFPKVFMEPIEADRDKDYWKHKAQ